MAVVKVLKNALCFIMGYLVSMEIRVTLFWLVHFCMIHRIGPINVCTDFDIDPYKIDEFRKYAKLVFYLTSRDVTTTSGSKARPKQWFSCFRWLWPWPLTYVLFLSHVLRTWCTGISMRSFIRIRPVLMSDMPRHTHTLEKGQIVIMILMDLSRAFDCIPYKLFISKLRAYGLSINACNYIMNYYINRQQCVKLGKIRSEWLFVNKGWQHKLQMFMAVHFPISLTHSLKRLFWNINRRKTYKYSLNEQAFREFLVSPALISNLNGHKSVTISHVNFPGVYEKIMKHVSGSTNEI